MLRQMSQALPLLWVIERAARHADCQLAPGEGVVGAHDAACAVGQHRHGILPRPLHSAPREARLALLFLSKKRGGKGCGGDGEQSSSVPGKRECDGEQRQEGRHPPSRVKNSRESPLLDEIRERTTPVDELRDECVLPMITATKVAHPQRRQPPSPQP